MDIETFNLVLGGIVVLSTGTFVYKAVKLTKEELEKDKEKQFKKSLNNLVQELAIDLISKKEEDELAKRLVNLVNVEQIGEPKREHGWLEYEMKVGKGTYTHRIIDTESIFIHKIGYNILERKDSFSEAIGKYAFQKLQTSN